MLYEKAAPNSCRYLFNSIISEREKDYNPNFEDIERLLFHVFYKEGRKLCCKSRVDGSRSSDYHKDIKEKNLLRNETYEGADKSMKYMIAVDSGGTKTDAVLFDQFGHILRRDVSPGANGMDIGKEEALRRFLGVMDRLVPLAPERISAIYGGIAGVMPLGDFYTPVVGAKNYADSIRFADDGPSMISAAIGHRDGCGMVVGTGSSCFIRVEGEPLRKVGGKGYLIDTGGSGFELGRDALVMAFRATDGRCPHTALVELIEAQMGVGVDRWMEKIYDPVTGGRPFIASFAHNVFKARAMDDWAAGEIFDRGAFLLGDLTRAAAKWFDGAFTVVMNGGLVSNFPEYAAAIRAASHERANVILGDAPPVYGSAVEAMWDAGMEADDTFRANFLADYAAAQNR